VLPGQGTADEYLKCASLWPFRGLLLLAAEVLGATTKKDTVNAALREVGQRLVRLRALARLGEMSDRGDFDEFRGNKAAYRT
jgi:hypothetical protein